MTLKNCFDIMCDLNRYAHQNHKKTADCTIIVSFYISIVICITQFKSTIWNYILISPLRIQL